MTGSAIKNTNAFNRFQTIVATVETWLAHIASAVLIIITALLIANAFGRYLLRSPIPASYNVTEILMAAFIFLPLAYDQKLRAHLSVQLLTSKLKGKWLSVVDIITLFVVLVVFLIMGIQNWKSVLFAYKIQDVTSAAPFVITWPFRTAVALGISLFCVRVLIQIFEDFMQTSKHGRNSETLDTI